MTLTPLYKHLQKLYKPSTVSPAGEATYADRTNKTIVNKLILCQLELKHLSLYKGELVTEIRVRLYFSSGLKENIVDSVCALWAMIHLSDVVWMAMSPTRLRALARNVPLTKYIQSGGGGIAHAPGMMGTFSPPPTSQKTAS